MIFLTPIFIAILSFAVTTSNAFTVSKVGNIRQVSITSPTQRTRTVVCGHQQDGMTNESSLIQDKIDPDEIMYMALSDVSTVQHTEPHILKCITSITGMQLGDAYDAICCSRGVAKFTDLGQWPRKEAEEYYEQLVMNGIPVTLCDD
jgi:hypothetical protein